MFVSNSSFIPSESESLPLDEELNKNDKPLLPMPSFSTTLATLPIGLNKISLTRVSSEIVKSMVISGFDTSGQLKLGQFIFVKYQFSEPFVTLIQTWRFLYEAAFIDPAPAAIPFA